MKRFVLTTLAAALVVAGGANASVNLLANGSFENGTSGWTLGGTTPGGYPAVVINYNAAAGYPVGAYGEAVPADSSLNPSPDAVGAHAVYFVSDWSNETLSQTVTLAAGRYEIGFSAYAPGNGWNNGIDAQFSGQIAGVTLANYSVKSGPSQAWQWFSGTVDIATAGDYAATFNFTTPGRGAAADIVIDRAYVVSAAPEPAGWAMLLLGFGAVGFMLRNRKDLLLATTA